mgnify:CR=1 FL=1
MNQRMTSGSEVGDQLSLPFKRRGGGLHVPETVPTRRGVVNAYADWLQEFPLSSFVTFTWSDEAAGCRYVYTDRAAVKDLQRFLDRELCYSGQYFGCIEDHRHRGVPHAHLLMEDCTDWRFAWSIWKRSRGLFCSRPAESGAFYYVAKYVLKDGRCGERVLERLCRGR